MIRALVIGKLLRFLGYPRPFEVQLHLIARVNFDDSGGLDHPEIRKMLQMLQLGQLPCRLVMGCWRGKCRPTLVLGIIAKVLAL